MKKLVFIIIIITLPLIAFFQYKKYKRFNPPTAYEYKVSDKIDVNYHEPSLVDEYYQKAVDAGSFARSQWKAREIDVRFPDADSQEEKNVAARYNQILSRLKQVETKLINSAKLKKQGYTNDKIQLIESGIPQAFVDFYSNTDKPTDNLTIGSIGEPVWNLQKILISKGYDHPLDGVFGQETFSALKKFQEDNQVYPSGVLTKQTLKKLIAKKSK